METGEKMHHAVGEVLLSAAHHIVPGFLLSLFMHCLGRRRLQNVASARPREGRRREKCCHNLGKLGPELLMECTDPRAPVDSLAAPAVP